MTLRVCALAVVAVACVDPAPAIPSPAWTCPGSWVESSLGGCGPAAVLCAHDGGAATGACARRDGGVALHALPDGAIGGLWHEPDHAGGAPSREWRPAAGFRECPANWTPDTDGVCTPVVPRCEGDSEPLPGGSCVPRASVACGETPPDLPPGVAPLYVRADAPAAGADGTLAHPFASIARALTDAPPDAWVVLAPGEYAERVVVNDRVVHLRGACWERTVIRSPDATSNGALSVSGTTARLDLGDVTVQGARGGVWVVGGASLRATRVRVERSTYAGVYVGGGGTRAEIEDVLVRDITPLDPTRYGLGVRVDEGGSLTMRDVAIVRSTRFGLAVVGAGSRAEGTRTLVRDVREYGDATVLHAGVRALDGGAVRLRGAVIRGAHGPGVAVEASGSRVELDESSISNGASQTSAGIFVRPGGSVVGRRVVVRENPIEAVVVEGAGTSLTLEDATVIDNENVGVYASDRALVTLSRVDVARNRTSGVAVYNGARGDLVDVIVRATRSASNGAFGRGVEAVNGASLTARRALLEDNHAVGVEALGADARVTLEDTVVRGTLPRRDGSQGAGIAALNAGALVATRVRLEGNHSVSAVAQAGSLEFRDGLILDTRVATTGGYGVVVSERGSGLVERSAIHGSIQAGAVAGDPGASLHLRDVAVRDVVPRARDGVGGWGVRAIYGARLVAERLLVERVSSAGVMAYAEDADVTLTDVIVVDVRATASGFGAGLVAFDRGHVHGARVAVLDARGAGVVSAAFVREGAGATVFGATVSVEDLFVRGVRPSSVDSTNARAPAAAYGVFVGRDCAGELARATLADADWGFFHSAGSLTLRRALLARQRRGAGAANLVDASHPLRLEDLRFRENASDVIQRDIDLPTLRLEPPPEPALPRLSP